MNNMKYSSSYTQKYNGGYIHGATIDGHEVIRVQVDAYAYPIEMKSIRAAKILITQHVNSRRSLSRRAGSL